MSNDNTPTKIPPAFVPADALTDPELSDCCKLILGLITTMAAGRGFWCSNGTIAEWLGKTPGTVSGSLKTLEDRGYITRHQPPDGSPRVIKIRQGLLENEQTPSLFSGDPPTENPVAYKTSLQDKITRGAPTVAEVRKYALAIHATEAEADGFMDHFTSNGWKVGGKTPMKDWKAAFRTWHRRTLEWSKSKQRGPARQQMVGFNPADYIRSKVTP